jgi:hypothetical protein
VHDKGPGCTVSVQLCCKRLSEQCLSAGSPRIESSGSMECDLPQGYRKRQTGSADVSIAPVAPVGLCHSGSLLVCIAHMTEMPMTEMLLQLREKKDEAATRDRFWDVTNSKIGQLTGTTAKEVGEAEAHAAEASKLAVKFGGTGMEDGGVLDSMGAVLPGFQA